MLVTAVVVVAADGVVEEDGAGMDVVTDDDLGAAVCVATSAPPAVG